MTSSKYRRLLNLALTVALVVVVSAQAPFPVEERREANNLMLPKRLVAQIGNKVNLHFTDNEIENAFRIGKDLVDRNFQLEDEIEREGFVFFCKFDFIIITNLYH